MAAKTSNAAPNRQNVTSDSIFTRFASFSAVRDSVS